MNRTLPLAVIAVIAEAALRPTRPISRYRRAGSRRGLDDDMHAKHLCLGEAE